MRGVHEEKEETSPTGKAKAHSSKENNGCCACCNCVDLLHSAAIILTDKAAQCWCVFLAITICTENTDCTDSQLTIRHNLPILLLQFISYVLYFMVAFIANHK